ncbi:MAG: PIN domain-containing protein [Candidatus Micrarchaeota archaeon]
MDLVVDANILFASLIKQGKTIELLFNEDFRLFAPEFIIEELLEHEEEILQKSKRTRAKTLHENSSCFFQAFFIPQV